MVTVLRVDQLSAGYGQLRVLHEVSLEVKAGELVSLLGSNGAGKSTFLRAISGILPYKGDVYLADGKVSRLPAERLVRRGLSHIPENRLTFGELTVEDNLDLGAWGSHNMPKRERDGQKEQVYELFPALSGRRKQIAGTMSGGEQQMLAVARGLMSKPTVLVLDEPSVGLAPQVVSVIFDVLQRLAAEGLAILLVEQNARAALKNSSRVYVLDRGNLVAAGTPTEIEDSGVLQMAYFGGSNAASGDSHE